MTQHLSICDVQKTKIQAKTSVQIAKDLGQNICGQNFLMFSHRLLEISTEIGDD